VANNLAPFGFRPSNTSNGPVNWRISTRRISKNNATPIFKGDVTVPVVGAANGYITQGATADFAAPGTPCSGIFWGCQYLSVSQKRTVWNQYWPGSDSQEDVIAYVIDDPNARFIVQADSTAFNITGTPTEFLTSPVGQLANFSDLGGNTNTQQSGMVISTLGSTATFPFIVTDLVLAPPGSNGTDPTSIYNWVEVGFNNEWLRGNAGVTGIV